MQPGPRTPCFSALTSLVLLAASDLVVALINVTAVCESSWEWSSNTLGQNACTVAAHLMAPCFRGSITVEPLAPGFLYAGPSSVEEATLCTCNPVTYNLLSACDGCQGSPWLSWSEWSFNCTTMTLSPTYPFRIPSGTLVPQWALLDTPLENFWNVTTAFVVGNLPEIQPGSLIGTSASASVSPTSSTSQSGASTSPSTTVSPSSSASSPFPSSGSGSNTGVISGAIAGGVAGGFVVLAIIGGTMLYFLRRRMRAKPLLTMSVVDSRATPPPSAMDMTQVRPPMASGDQTTHVPEMSVPPMKFYDLNDPSAYSRYQSVPSALYVHAPVSP